MAQHIAKNLDEKALVPNKLNPNNALAKWTVGEVYDAFDTCFGIRSAICQKLGCKSSELNHWIEADEERKIRLSESRNVILDLSESELIRIATTTNDEKTAAGIFQFFLKQLGSARGYTPAGSALQINVNSGNQPTEVIVQNIFGVPPHAADSDTDEIEAQNIV